MKNPKVAKLTLASAILMALGPVAWAAGATATPQQAAPSAPSAQTHSSQSPTAPSKPQTLETVVVTGNINLAGIKQLDASYAINTLSDTQIKDFAPHGTADLLRTIPGNWVEASGGASGANVYVSGFPGAGDAHFVNTELNGAPLYGAYGLSFMSSPDLFRIDDSVKRVEVVQNGPNDIFGPGRPGETVNFIQKDGTETPGGAGSVRVSLGTEGFRRLDAYWGGEIAPSWYLAAGGFAREGDGVHHTSFPINRGGQFEGILTHKFDNNNGSISFSARHTDDDDMFFTSSPLISVNGHLSALPEFDPRKDTLAGRDLHYVDLEVTPGNPPGTIARNLQQGRGIDLSVYGSKFSWKFGQGWSITNNANFVYGNVPTNALFNGNAPPQTIASFITDSVTTANGDPAVVAHSGLATGGTAVFTDNGEPVPSNQLVLQTGFWTVQKHIRSFTDQLNLAKELFDGNTLTLGGYYASYGTDDTWFLGNNVLTTLQNNAQMVDVALNNGVVVSHDGFSGPATDAFTEHWRGRNVAGFISDSWFVGRWLFSGGVRLEHQDATGYAQNSSNVDLDGNPATLYNNHASVLNGTFTRYQESKTHAAWSFGANYGITTTMAAYARVSRGQLFPMFDDIQGGNSGIQTVRQYEVGFKSQGHFYSANISAFYNHFNNLPFQAFVERNGQIINITESGTSQAKGVEFDLTVHPVRNFDVQFLGDWLKGNYETFGDFSGNQLQRQPRLQFRITPMYTIPASWGSVRLYATYTHVGSRFSDPSNVQVLPSYHTIDAGVEALVGRHWSFRLTGRNLTNTLALTEGNVRALGEANGGGDIVYGRSIFGRAWMLSAAYKFTGLGR